MHSYAPSVISPADLDELMNQGWRARSEVNVEGWTVRLSAGVTQRANSVLPLGTPSDMHEAVAQAERLYLEHGLTPRFQISPAAQPAGLDEYLAGRGYELHSPTSVQVAEVEDVLRRFPPSSAGVQVDDLPSETWLDLWWSVDGHSGLQERAVAREIVASGPALYASYLDGAEAAAVGRLALAGHWGGLYCLAVRPDARRQGYAMAVLRTLLENAADQGIQRVWLQVAVVNEAARALYRLGGFHDVSRYHYRTLAAQIT